MQNLTISQLWATHFADTNNTSIRGQIALRDPEGTRQLQPIIGPCFVESGRQTVMDLEGEYDAMKDRAEEAEEAANNTDTDEDLEQEVEDLKRDKRRLQHKLDTVAAALK